MKTLLYSIAFLAISTFNLQGQTTFDLNNGTGVNLGAGTGTNLRLDLIPLTEGMDYRFFNTDPDQDVLNEIQTFSNVGNIYTLSKGGGSFTLPSIAASKTFNNNVSRSLNSNYTVSTTRDALTTYSINVSCTNPLLAGSSTANAFLEYSTDAGTTWITVSDISNGSSVGLTVSLQLTQPSKYVLSGAIPANALVRLRSSTTGTASVSYGRGQEVLF